MQARWLRIWSPAPRLPPSHQPLRRAHSASPRQKPKPSKRDPLKVIQHHANIAELQHAAETSLAPSARPIANLSKSLRHFHQFIDSNSFSPRKPLDFHKPAHAEAWQVLLKKGWEPLELQGNLTKLLRQDQLLFGVLKLTAQQLQQWPEGSPEALEAWRRFETIISLLVRQENRDGSVTCSSRYMDTVVADWIWTGFRDAGLRTRHAGYVLKLWRLLLRIQRPPKDLKASQSYNLRLSQEVHNGIVTAASLSDLSLPDFIHQYASSTSLQSLKDASLATGIIDSRTQNTLEQHLGKLQRKTARAWIQQADLALTWARGGSSALHQRIRRWADRRDGLLIERHLDAFFAACRPDLAEQSWLELLWKDEVGQDALAGPEEEDAEGAESTTRTNQPFDKTLQVTPSLFGSFIISLMRLDRVDRVERLWHSLEDLGLQPTPSLWHALLAGQMRRGDSKGASAVIESMKSAGIEVSPMVHLDEARTLFRAGEIPAGMAKVNWMMQTFKPLPTEAYKRLFHIMIRRGLSSQALNLLHDMPRDQIDISVLNPFITWYCRKDHSELGYQEAIEMIQRFKIAPDAVTYTILLNGALDSGRHDDAARLVAEMQNRGELQSTRVYGSILTHLAQSGSAQLLQQALLLLGMLERSNPQALNEIVYADIVKALCQQGDLQPPHSQQSGKQQSTSSIPYNLREAHAVVSKMQSKGIPVTVHVYNALLAGHVSQQTSASAQRALQLLAELREANKTKVGRDFVDPATWRTLIYGFIRADQWAPAKQVLSEMDKLSFKPQGALAQAAQRVRDYGR